MLKFHNNNCTKVILEIFFSASDIANGQIFMGYPIYIYTCMRARITLANIMRLSGCPLSPAAARVGDSIADRRTLRVPCIHYRYLRPGTFQNGLNVRGYRGACCSIAPESDYIIMNYRRKPETYKRLNVFCATVRLRSFENVKINCTSNDISTCPCPTTYLFMIIWHLSTRTANVIVHITISPSALKESLKSCAPTTYILCWLYELSTRRYFKKINTVKPLQRITSEFRVRDVFWVRSKFSEL